MPSKQVVVTETVLLHPLTVHAFFMTRNGIGRKEKERKSTRPPAVFALMASSFSQFQTSVTRNFSSCLLSETIPAIAFSYSELFQNECTSLTDAEPAPQNVGTEQKLILVCAFGGRGGGWAGVGVVVPLGIW